MVSIRELDIYTISEEACQALGLSYQALKDKYKDYPICLIEYIEGSIYQRVIEVRFDEQKATISISFDKENICNGAYLFFDNLMDEDSFIEYLNREVQHDFKRRSWIMANCYLKVKPSKYETAFFYYK